jgi:hypothetical protein
MVHTDGTYHGYFGYQEDAMDRVQLWRHVSATGDLPAGEDRDRATSELAAHLGQRLVVALDVEDRSAAQHLRDRLEAWLDLARAAAAVRALLDAQAGPRARRLLAGQREAVLGWLAEDLAATGAVDPGRAAVDLLREAEQVAVAEQVAGRVLRGERAALTGARPVRRRLRLPRLVPAQLT